MKRSSALACLALALLFSSGCKGHPQANEANFSPSGARWVRVEQLPPDAKKEQLLPTYRLRLERAHSFDHLDLVADVETLCGIEARWLDEDNLLLRVPVRQAKCMLLPGSETWDGIQIRVDLHQDQVRQEVYSADRQRRLVVIADCQTGDWNLYLRRGDEPNFNAAMETGWDDPDVFGGFSIDQPPSYLRWTGPRSAEIGIPDKRYKVTLREKIGDVSVQWKFLQRLVKPKEEYQTLKAIKPVKK